MAFEMENIKPNMALMQRRIGFRQDRIQEITDLQTIMSEIAALNEEAFDVLDSPLAKACADRADGFHTLIGAALKQLATTQKLKLNYNKPKRANELPSDRLHFIMEEINLLVGRGVNLLPDDESKNAAQRRDGWYAQIKIALGSWYHSWHDDYGASASSHGSFASLEVEMQRFQKEEPNRYQQEKAAKAELHPPSHHADNGYQPSSW